MSETARQKLRALAADLKARAAPPTGSFRAVLDTLTQEGSDAQKGALLGLINAHDDRAYAVPLLTEAALFLREHANFGRIAAPDHAIDIVGTGGDGHNTFNISTAAAFVVAGAGVPVAKHGNRAVSSRSGASDVLAALGVNLDAPMPAVERAIHEASVGFLWAPRHHPAMKEWAKVRAELGFRTLFNLLGPLCNPALVKRQVIGVFARDWVRPVAEVMHNLGSQRVLVVHGDDGLDELTTTGCTHIAELRDGAIQEYEVLPEHAGLPRAALADLTGGDATANAGALRAVLVGTPGPYRDIVLLNAGAALMVAGQASDIRSGVTLAAAAIDSGKARAALDALIRITNDRITNDAP